MIASSVCEPPLETPAELDGLLTNLRLESPSKLADAEFRDAAKSTDEVDTLALMGWLWLGSAPRRRIPRAARWGRARSSFPSDSFSFEPGELIATGSGLLRRLAAIPLPDGKDE